MLANSNRFESERRQRPPFLVCLMGEINVNKFKKCNFSRLVKSLFKCAVNKLKEYTKLQLIHKSGKSCPGIFNGRQVLLKMFSVSLSLESLRSRYLSSGRICNPFKMSTSRITRAGLDNERLKEFSGLVRKDGIKDQSCQHIISQTARGYFTGSRATALRANSSLFERVDVTVWV